MDNASCTSTMPFFSSEDIQSAMTRCNFEKGIGPDAFDGRLLKDELVRAAVADFLRASLNSGEVPEHITEGRLVLLTKGQGHRVVPVEETRPIVVNSHLQNL